MVGGSAQDPDQRRMTLSIPTHDGHGLPAGSRDIEAEPVGKFLAVHEWADEGWRVTHIPTLYRVSIQGLPARWRTKAAARAFAADLIHLDWNFTTPAGVPQATKQGVFAALAKRGLKPKYEEGASVKTGCR